MKELKKIALMSAIALVGTAGFTACSSDDAAEDLNTGLGQEVKTQFAISIPAAMSGTRMSDANVQAAGKAFLGMKGINLIPTDGTVETTTTISKKISLGDITGITATESSKVYKDISIPTGTDGFLFYGESANTSTQNYEKGILTSTLGTAATVGDITFKLNPILSGTVFEDDVNDMCTLLSNVANAAGWADSKVQALINLRNDFTTHTTAGSVSAVTANLVNLYNAVNAITAQDAANVKAAITGAIKTCITITDGKGSWNNANVDDEFPRNLNLPDGAVAVKWDATNKKFVSNDNVLMAANINPASICYPAALNYFVETGLRASDVLVDDTEWPKTTENWDTETNWTNFSGTEVKATTQSIALKKNIQYGVALLQSNVKCATATLKDNGSIKGDASTVQTITVPSGGFTVTGILVGGQPTLVGYNYLPIADGASKQYTYTVFDKDVTNIVADYNATGGTNYTLVLDNNGATEDNGSVKVAVELVNNSNMDFYGADNNLIAKGEKFYLVAKLDPSNKTITGVTNPTVFMQDYTTTANFTISSLKNGYVTIPDLRATNMQLGLSVDLEWKTGMTFDVNLGGN